MNRALLACAIVFWAAAVGACATDIGIDDFKYACQKTTECGEGQTCQNGWCTKITVKQDGGATDAAVHKDAGVDSGFDAGADAGLDAGFDAGPHGDGGYVIRYTSTFDSAAGTGSSTDYKLKAVTGWSVGPRWSVGDYKLKIGQPFSGPKQ